ncbi:hypothetical protein PC9H_001583 [Pleurotus ostreatus]|uniref:Uncharacterized protein n=1 Tax=Pleurotus ostreatus TaxID=5322 RepID=A0A8H7A5M3_PLEOS|nr:uncharacterized protein PC9H_001583 [Pleurotus ostreatus]KAF7441234.1 hypothetical protein PC9H_001583 [Pleurotus ostreatus]KAJ8699254.1 hypothetical protein PTI98_002386 [Pleurotus ostreatus]
MAEQVLAKFDSNRFLWKELPSEGIVSRILGGGEFVQDVYNRHMKGEQNLFIGAHVNVSATISRSQLTNSARATWLWLRYHVPAIATSIVPDDEGTSCLVYKPANEAEVNEWANRTFIVSQHPQADVEPLRLKLGEEKIPSKDGLQTWAHLVLTPGSDREPASKFGFLVRTHHAPFDGVGLKIMLNRYLIQLAKHLGSSDVPQSPLQWGSEASNLAPAVYNVLLPSVPRAIPPNSSEEPSFAHPYYGTMGAVLQSIGEAMKIPYGFKPRPSDSGWPSPGREVLFFSASESAQLLASLKPSGKADVSKAYTLTHLAHAALAMTVMADNPPTADAAGLVLGNLHLRNCREFLIEPYSSRDGYSGYALGVSHLSVPVSLFIATDGKPAPLDKKTLVKAMNAVRDSYGQQKALPDPINYMGQASLIFMQNIIAGAKANMLPPNNCYAFSSDGISEKQLDNSFTDSLGKAVLELSDVFISVNHIEPAPFFRISSWKGIIELGADYNKNLISAAEVKIHMENWKRSMLLATKLEGGDY